MQHATAVPSAISDVEHLEDLLSEPTGVVVDTLRRLDGDVIVLGVAGKMGPTLARMARRAMDLAGVRRRVIGVSRFGSPDQEDALRRHGIETIRCDLLDEAAVAKLPDAPNVIFMAGRKFGSSGDEPLTWAMNTYLPSLVCRRYATSRIVAFSTGNVYGLRRAGTGGSVETDSPNPVGEYAMSCLGRERIFEHFSRALGTPTVLVRLNYAAEMRYGVVADLARRVRSGEPVDVTMGYFNVIWQGDANAMALALIDRAASPALIANVAGPEELSVRDTCETLARLMHRPVAFTGSEAPDALLSNGSFARRLCGEPRIDARQLIAWSADWVQRGGPSLDKPTHFESRDGKF
jgi:nucleoside-diphosphate-sugar epimerase